MYFGMSLLQKHPEVHNLPGPRTERNFKNSRMFVSWIKLEIVLVFVYIIWRSIQDSLGQPEGLGVWFLPALAAVFILTIVIFVIRIIRNK